jgi:hypothetical protein
VTPTPAVAGPCARARRRLGAAVVAAAAVCAVCAVCACRGHDAPGHDPPAPAPGSAQAAGDAPALDLAACRAAAARVPQLPPARRAQALLDACRPCGDWQPLLAWNTPVTEGGPSRAAIERALVACHAFCEPNARQRFLGTLDAARGQDTRGPWRYLGEICKAEVSADPDTRFMGAPYFALDRIARALGDPGPGDPARLAAIELPLPALSVTGVGVELPRAPETAAPAGPPALTIYASLILLSELPVARLSASGLAVSGDYPGAEVAADRLAAALAQLAESTGSPAAAPEAPVGDPVALLAPRSLPAARIADVVAAAGGHDLRLGVGLPGPGGWTLPGTLPVALLARPAAHGVRIELAGDPAPAIAAVRAALRADLERAPPTIAVDRAATAESLASVLGALAALGVKTCAITAAVPPAAVTPRPTKP